MTGNEAVVSLPPEQIPLSSAEAFYSRALGKKYTRGARRLGRGKIKARVPRAPVFSLQRFRSRFFLWYLLTGASAEEREQIQLADGMNDGEDSWTLQVVDSVPVTKAKQTRRL